MMWARRMARTAVFMAVSVALGPVPVLVHGSRIRRLATTDQRVKSHGTGTMNRPVP